MPRLYHYVGPPAIAATARTTPSGRPIRRPDDVAVWIRDTRQEPHGGFVIATFVVDAAGQLRIADRRSEHVACAGGGPVRSAGELTWEVGPPITVAAMSNQSTGYCPEPNSWPTVAASLVAAGFEPPAGFDPACIFRRCPECKNITLVKEAVFECGICGDLLPPGYNVQ